MLPIRDRDRPTKRAWVTAGLVIANVLVFLLWQPTFQPRTGQDAFFFCHAMIPYEITHQRALARDGNEPLDEIRASFGGLSDAEARDLLTFVRRRCADKQWALPLVVAMFLHGGWLHIVGNMLFLWVFGKNVEARLGHLRFLLFYLVGGLVASAVQIAFGVGSTVPTIGASGAIAAVLGASIVMYPRGRILTLILPFFIPIELPAAVLLGAWFVLQFFDGIGSIGNTLDAGIAYWAHVGGFLAGVGGTYLLYGRKGARAPARLPSRPDVLRP